MKVGLLAQLIGIASCETLSPAQGRRLSAAIQELGWRMAPDPTISGGSPSWEQELALFQPLATEPSPQLPVLSGLLYLTAIVCGGSLGKEQLEIFRRLVVARAPGDADWRYLRGTVLVLRRDPGIALSSLARIAKGIVPACKENVLVAMSEVACSSGDLSVEQVRRLLRIGRAFELEAFQVRAIIEKTLGSAGVVILRKYSGAGERIPLRTEPFALDLARIEALSIETREVAALLAEIMTDDPIEAEKLEDPKSLQGPGWLAQLEYRFHAPLLTLIARTEISREDFNLLAALHHLLPEDLFCSINTWSDDTLGDFLIEEGDPIRIHRELIKEPYAAASRCPPP